MCEHVYVGKRLRSDCTDILLCCCAGQPAACVRDQDRLPHPWGCGVCGVHGQTEQEIRRTQEGQGKEGVIKELVEGVVSITIIRWALPGKSNPMVWQLEEHV